MQYMCYAFEDSLPEKTRPLLKETEKNKILWIKSDSQVVTLLPSVSVRPPKAALSIQISIFFGT